MSDNRTPEEIIAEIKAATSNSDFQVLDESKPEEKKEVNAALEAKEDDSLVWGTRMAELSNEMAAIHAEFGGFSHVPLSHPRYWALRDEIQALHNSKK